jgi:hypothetical protein
MKGALISFMPTFVGSLPNVIVFQYNPETITHTWTAAGKQDASAGPKAGVDPTAADGLPGETFAFKLLLDANDMIADSGSNPIAGGLASVSGVYPRLSALEMLQYPTGSFGGSGLLGSVSAAISSAGLSLPGTSGGADVSTTVPRGEVPTVLFVWGPQRIVPVRVTELSITETLYDSLLNPTHAEVSLTLKVMTPEEITAMTGEMKQIAKAAYVYSQGLRQVQAVANLGDAAASIVGMLPNPF